ncbi:transposase family protein, partial [Acinetobacter baumannii]
MTDILDLSNWTVLDAKHGDELIIEAEYTRYPDACPKCNSSIYKHGTKTVAYRDAPVRGKPVVIHAILRRFRCRDCRFTFTQPTNAMHPEMRMTWRFDFHIVKLRLLIEIEGSPWSGGRGGKLSNKAWSLDRYDHAEEMGYKIERFHPDSILSGYV